MHLPKASFPFRDFFSLHQSVLPALSVWKAAGSQDQGPEFQLV